MFTSVYKMLRYKRAVQHICNCVPQIERETDKWVPYSSLPIARSNNNNHNYKKLKNDSQPSGFYRPSSVYHHHRFPFNTSSVKYFFEFNAFGC